MTTLTSRSATSVERPAPAAPRPARVKPRRNTKKSAITAIVYVVVIIWTLISVFPAAFALISSFKLKRDVLDPTKFIFTPTVQNYVDLFTTNHMGGYIQNSVIVTVGSVVPSLILALMAAYGLTRFGLKKERSVALNVLSFRMIPAIAVVIPFFLIAQFAQLLDTQIILIIATMTMNVPLAVWMLRGFMRDIPIEIDEAAQLDGASRWRILWTVHVRILGPGIVSAGLLLVIQTWNEFAFAQFLTSIDARTFPTTVNFFISIAGTNFGQMAAAVTVGTIPILVLAMIFQKRLVSGLSYGAV
jgi:multiple sugar transport system permease protein